MAIIEDSKKIKSSFGSGEYFSKVIFIIMAGLCLTPWITPPMALLGGFITAQLIGNPFVVYTRNISNILLKVSVIGLGFGMNFHAAMKAGSEGLLFTIFSILLTFLSGILLGRLFKIEDKTAYLLSAGTAICGGSAIAAISPVINAKQSQISVALGIVFILNSIALLLFPFIGWELKLSSEQFGVWAAIAIHDTSSVVGAATAFDEASVGVATTVKLMRALWIIPLIFISSVIFRSKTRGFKIPYFIGLFIIAMLMNTYWPFVQQFSFTILQLAKAGLTLTLFLIGAGLSRKVLISVGYKPFILGLLLWTMISVVALVAVILFY